MRRPLKTSHVYLKFYTVDLKDLLEERIRQKVVALPQENIRQIILELKAWLKPSVEEKGIVQTQSGDYTLVHPLYGEPYHSLSAGAIRECIEKFLEPSGLLEKAENLKKVRILDIGFGLGYNIAVAIKKLRDINPSLEIEILSFEKELPQSVPPLPEEFAKFHRLLWDNLPEFERDGIRFRLYLGDARQSILEISEFSADAVFHDGFSPYRNPELWTLDFLSQIKRLISQEGTWVSYTSSLPVRKALKELGFGICTTKSVGRKRGGTKACFSCKDNLSDEERKKLSTSPYALPFLDPTLKGEPLDILIDYRIRVELLKVAQGGFEPPTPRFSAGCSTN